MIKLSFTMEHINTDLIDSINLLRDKARQCVCEPQTAENKAMKLQLEAKVNDMLRLIQAHEVNSCKTTSEDDSGSGGRDYKAVNGNKKESKKVFVKAEPRYDDTNLQSFKGFPAVFVKVEPQKSDCSNKSIIHFQPTSEALKHVVMYDNVEEGESVQLSKQNRKRSASHMISDDTSEAVVEEEEEEDMLQLDSEDTTSPGTPKKLVVALQKPFRWTKEQDNYLRQLYEVFEGNWTEIANVMQCTPDECSTRWIKLIKNELTRTWDHKEMNKLTRLVEDNSAGAQPGIDWLSVSEGMKRSVQDCKRQWREMCAQQRALSMA